MKDQNNENVEFYQKLIAFTENNKKAIIGVTAGIVVLVTGLFLYSKYISGPREKEAYELLSVIEDYYEKDSFELVLKGGVGLKSAVNIADDYSSTKAGNIAAYIAGTSFLRTGDYPMAIKYLNKFSPNDDHLIGSMALACIGDAYAEQGETKEALRYYIKAVEYNAPNDLTTPLHARKAISLLIEFKEYAKAEKLIKSIDVEEGLLPQFKYELQKYLGLIETLKNNP
jgi:tetratricopeptide (TPR) repeat protein